MCGYGKEFIEIEYTDMVKFEVVFSLFGDFQNQNFAHFCKRYFKLKYFSMRSPGEQNILGLSTLDLYKHL